MFNHIIRPVWAILTQTFLGTPELKKKAGNAFICLVLSLAFSAVTAWLSFPVYRQYASISMHPDQAIIAGWTLAIIVAFAMFLFDSTIGYFFCEKLKGLESILDAHFVGVIALLAVCIGAFDAYKGSTTGAEKRAKEAYVVQSFTEASQGKAKPYSAEIAEIDRQIKTLLSDEQKVMWKGKLTTPYKNILMVEKLQKQRDSYVSLQLEELEEMRSLHTEHVAENKAGQQDAETTLAGIAIVLYILQIILAIPLASFDIACDMTDGSRDGVYAKSGFKDFTKKHGQIGFATAHQVKQEMSPSERQQIGFRSGRQSGNDSGILQAIFAKLEELANRNVYGQNVPEKAANVPPKEYQFSRVHQPDRQAPKRHGRRADSNEARQMIKAAYKTLSQAGTKPTYKAISQATGLSVRCIGDHVREMKREGIIK